METNSEIKTPICDFVKSYALSGKSRFHMPGHKGRSGEYSAICRADITEVSGADSLYEADGIILASEKIASEIFGTGATFYSTEGSSQCVKAMLALVSGDGGNRVILAARNVHASFVSAAALLDLDVEWLYPDRPLSNPYACPISARSVREKIGSLKEKPAAVYLTSPDYPGGMQDIEEIAKAAHEVGVPLLVDNAHGAYLHFLEKPAHPLDLGADMCCDSAHKTLPALTGCAYLHIAKSPVKGGLSAEEALSHYTDRARDALALFGSTSPSYLLLLSLDALGPYLAGGFRKDLEGCVRECEEVRRTARDAGWKMYGDCGAVPCAAAFEPMKITVDCRNSGCEGVKLAEALRRRGVECETADPDFTVLMPSPSNTREDFGRLKEALKETSGMAGGSAREGVLIGPHDRAMSIREAYFSPFETVSARDSAGRIFARGALSCPPAVPITVSGEVISADTVRAMEYYGTDKVKVVIEKSV